MTTPSSTGRYLYRPAFSSEVTLGVTELRPSREQPIWGQHKAHSFLHRSHLLEGLRLQKDLSTGSQDTSCCHRRKQRLSCRRQAPQVNVTCD